MKVGGWVHVSDIQSGFDDGWELDNIGTAGQFTAV